MQRRHVERFLEFLLIGVLMGVAEDLIALKLATGAAIDMRVLWVVVLVAIPFAAVSELVVDREEVRPFRELSRRIHRRL
ncbi:MAG: hypothetical protein SVW02_04370 [Candidatus Nanohaloarchaea archaeon]|nr:hypothetical protein [Candidatus Nanohaloarchaea archaeon]